MNEGEESVFSNFEEDLVLLWQKFNNNRMSIITDVFSLNWQPQELENTVVYQEVDMGSLFGTNIGDEKRNFLEIFLKPHVIQKIKEHVEEEWKSRGLQECLTLLKDKGMPHGKPDRIELRLPIRKGILYCVHEAPVIRNQFGEKCTKKFKYRINVNKVVWQIRGFQIQVSLGASGTEIISRPHLAITNVNTYEFPDITFTFLANKQSL